MYLCRHICFACISTCHEYNRSLLDSKVKQTNETYRTGEKMFIQIQQPHKPSARTHKQTIAFTWVFVVLCRLLLLLLLMLNIKMILSSHIRKRSHCFCADKQCERMNIIWIEPILLARNESRVHWCNPKPKPSERVLWNISFQWRMHNAHRH